MFISDMYVHIKVLAEHCIGYEVLLKPPCIIVFVLYGYGENTANRQSSYLLYMCILIGKH